MGTFGTIEICSRQGELELMSVYYSASSAHSRLRPCAIGAYFLAWAQKKTCSGSAGCIKFVADLNFSMA